VLLNRGGHGCYVGARLGPGPRDGLMTGLHARTGWSVRWVRTGIELTVLTVGWLLGGTVGVGTVLYAVSIGPLTRCSCRGWCTASPTPTPGKPTCPSRFPSTLNSASGKWSDGGRSGDWTVTRRHRLQKCVTTWSAYHHHLTRRSVDLRSSLWADRVTSSSASRYRRAR